MAFWRRRSIPDEQRVADARASASRRADELEARGALASAIDVLAELHREHPTDELELRLRALRLRAGQAAGTTAPRSDWPPAYDDPFPGQRGQLPEVPATALTTDVLGGAVAHHGALIVRGALQPAAAARLAEAIEATHQSKQAATARDDDAFDAHDGWYQPLDEVDGAIRRWVSSTGGTWLADSPRSTELVLAELDAAGVTTAISGHLGERPVISLQKSTLRRTLPDHQLIAWHQDGSFLGDEVRTMNVWVALSPCGGTRPSPGLEILPQRLEAIVPPDGILSPISIAQEEVDQLAREHATVVPSFDPGDALLFDERLLHRTHLAPGMTDVRYALECWFFAPSTVTESYTPLLA